MSSADLLWKLLRSNRFSEKTTARWERETHTSCCPWKAHSQLALMYQPIQTTRSPAAGRTHVAFCPARAKGKGRELRAQGTWQMEKESESLLIIIKGKKLRSTAGGKVCKPKGSRVSLVHAHRTCLCCSSGWSPPPSFLLPSTTYAESASSLQHLEQSRKINTLCFQRSSNADEIYKNLSVTTYFLKL